MPLHYPPAASPPTTLHATLLDTPNPTTLRIRPNHTILLDPDGTITSLQPCPPKCPHPHPPILPSFTDLHLHAPQYPNTARHTTLPLMQWLEQHTFPLEARFADTKFAKEVYTKLVKRLLSEGTTAVMAYASGHLESTKLLYTISNEYGLRCGVGLVAGDRGGGEHADVETTKTFLDWCESEPPGTAFPVITPRFLPSCSEPLLAALGKLATERKVRVQTHVGESTEEVAAVQTDFGKPGVEVLAETRLLDGAVLAHCTHLAEGEWGLVKEHAASVASCPLSNILFARRVLAVRKVHDMGVRVGLGSDIAGGHDVSMLGGIRMVGVAGRVWEMEGYRTEEAVKEGAERVHWVRGLWMATREGAGVAGVEAGVFEVGKAWDAVEVELEIEGEEGDEEEEKSEEEWSGGLEKWVVGHGGRESIMRVWVQGRVVCERV